MITCKNCSNNFEGKFCPNCAQKASTHRFTLAHFGHELFHAFTHTDKGILFLIKELFVRPGKVAKEYNAGMRKKYFNPITFLLIGTALQLFAAQKTDFFTHFNDGVKKSVHAAGSISKEETEELDREMEKVNKINSKTMENSKLITFLIIPVLAFLTWLIFWKSGHNYAENLVFNVLISGQLSVYFLIVCIVPFLLFPSSVVLMFFLYYLIWLLYSLISYKQFFNQGWIKTIFKGLAIQILYLVIVQQLSFLIVKII